MQPGKDQLKVAREAGQSAAAAGAAQAEDTAAKDKALREANTRVAELEKTLKDLQRAVELKSQTLADLQRQSEAGRIALRGMDVESGRAPASPAISRDAGVDFTCV